MTGKKKDKKKILLFFFTFRLVYTLLSLSLSLNHERKTVWAWSESHRLLDWINDKLRTITVRARRTFSFKVYTKLPAGEIFLSLFQESLRFLFVYYLRSYSCNRCFRLVNTSTTRQFCIRCHGYISLSVGISYTYDSRCTISSHAINFTAVRTICSHAFENFVHQVKNHSSLFQINTLMGNTLPPVSNCTKIESKIFEPPSDN